MKAITHYLLLVTCLLFPMFGKAVEGVKLVCDQPVYNFGHIDQSAVITNVFIIRNEGDLTCELKGVQTTCSCTQGRLNRQMIGPGETAELTAVYTAARRAGPQKKGLKVMIPDSDTPVLTFYMEGFVEPSAESH